MIRIAVASQAYAAIEATLPIGSVGVEPEAGGQGAPGAGQGERFGAPVAVFGDAQRASR
jgi:hypothetical protein